MSEKKLRVYEIDRRLEQLQSETNAYVAPREQEARKLIEEKRQLLTEINAPSEETTSEGHEPES